MNIFSDYMSNIYYMYPEDGLFKKKGVDIGVSNFELQLPYYIHVLTKIFLYTWEGYETTDQLSYKNRNGIK